MYNKSGICDKFLVAPNFNIAKASKLFLIERYNCIAIYKPFYYIIGRSFCDACSRTFADSEMVSLMMVAYFICDSLAITISIAFKINRKLKMT